jgi:predicted SnoaL-like aldol condensation-catalyzing enzyme
MAMMTSEETKAFVLRAFDTLFNKRDYSKAAEFWSESYIQHSPQVEPGRDGLLNLVRSLPETMKYENQLIVVEDNYVMLHGRFSGMGRSRASVAANVLRIEGGRLAEHWDVFQDEATAAESKSGLPMFGNSFAALDRQPAPTAVGLSLTIEESEGS